MHSTVCGHRSRLGSTAVRRHLAGQLRVHGPATRVPRARHIIHVLRADGDLNGSSVRTSTETGSRNDQEAKERQHQHQHQQHTGEGEGEDDSEPQLVVAMNKSASFQVDDNGNVVDAETNKQVRMDGKAVDEPIVAEDNSKDISNTVMHAALDAIDLVSEATDEEKPITARVQELEGRYRMLDDRMDLVEMRVVELVKAAEAAAKASVNGTIATSGATSGASLDMPPQEATTANTLKEVSKIQSRFTEAVNSGQLESMKQMRENLMLHEWELSNKYWAQRRGISDFEAWCVEHNEEVDYELMTQLYEHPVDSKLLQQLPPRLRSMARSCVETACDQRMQEVFGRCTETALQFAQLSTTGVASGAGSRILKFIKRLLPFKIPLLG